MSGRGTRTSARFGGRDVGAVKTARGTLVVRVGVAELAENGTGTSTGALDRVRTAARLLREGKLVAFPTETVYGLGADATNDGAVRAIFAAKGRPQDNPLIAHVADLDGFYRLAASLTPEAEALARRFWPGPLTLVVEARPGILAPSVSAGLKTVGVRFPDHPVAAALIREAGVPVAAPSANVSGRPSPTMAEHVLADLDGRVACVVDSGPTAVGVESTVVDVTGAVPVLLRPGGVTREQIEETLGVKIATVGAAEVGANAEVGTDTGVGGDTGVGARVSPALPPRSPGLKYTHYKPKADVIVVEPESWDAPPDAGERIARCVVGLVKSRSTGATRQGDSKKPLGILATEENVPVYQRSFNEFQVVVLSAPSPPREPDTERPLCYLYVLGRRDRLETVAARLFAGLRTLDSAGVALILAEGFPEHGLGLAVMNRLRKSAGYRIAKC